MPKAKKPKFKYVNICGEAQRDQCFTRRSCKLGKPGMRWRGGREMENHSLKELTERLMMRFLKKERVEGPLVDQFTDKAKKLWNGPDPEVLTGEALDRWQRQFLTFNQRWWRRQKFEGLTAELPFMYITIAVIQENSLTVKPFARR